MDISDIDIGVIYCVALNQGSVDIWSLKDHLSKDIDPMIFEACCDHPNGTETHKSSHSAQFLFDTHLCCILVYLPHK